MVTREEVQKVLDEEIAPRLAMDGGGIELLDVTEDGAVKVRLQGACSGCPGAQMTMRMGVTRILQAALPDVKSVETA